MTRTGTIWVAAALGLASAGTLLANPTSFNPSIFSGFNYSDNVRYTENPGDTSDTSTTLGVALPVTREMERGSLSFGYVGIYDKYVDADALDYLQHRLRFSSTTRLTPVTNLRFAVNFVQTQDQLDPIRLAEELDYDPNVFLSRRTKERTVDVGINYGRVVSQRSSWTSNLSARRSDYELVTVGEPMQLDVEDRMSFGGGFSYSHRATERTDLSFGYLVNVADLDVSGEEKLHRLRFVVDHDFARKFGMGFYVGAFLRDKDQPVATDEGDDTGLEANIAFHFNESDGLALGPLRFRFGLGLTPSSTGSLQGSATNGRVWISASNTGTGNWFWSAISQYSRREPFDSALDQVQSVVIGTSIERSIMRTIGIRVEGRWTDQSSDDSALSDAAFYRASAAVTWYPLRRSGR